MDSESPISDISMIKSGSVTHSFDVEQRIYKPEFSQFGFQVEIDMPPSPNLATPGYYMIFAIDEAGTPSVAKTISVTGSPPEPTSEDFIHVENHSLSGFNEVRKNGSVDQCKLWCRNRRWCKSFDFHKINEYCILQDGSKIDQPLDEKNGSIYDHYYLDERLHFKFE